MYAQIIYVALSWKRYHFVHYKRNNSYNNKILTVPNNFVSLTPPGQ